MEYEQTYYGEGSGGRRRVLRKERDTVARSLSPGKLRHQTLPKEWPQNPSPSDAFSVSAVVPVVHFGSLLENVPWPDPQFELLL